MVLSASSVESVRHTGLVGLHRVQEAAAVRRARRVRCSGSACGCRSHDPPAEPDRCDRSACWLLVAGAGPRLGSRSTAPAAGSTLGPLSLQPVEVGQAGAGAVGRAHAGRQARVLGQCRHLLVPVRPGGAADVRAGHAAARPRRHGHPRRRADRPALVRRRAGPAVRRLAGGRSPVPCCSDRRELPADRVTRSSTRTTTRRRRRTRPAGAVRAGRRRLFGMGLGQGRSKWGTCPTCTPTTSSPIIGEELGFIGCLLVLGLFAMLAVAACGSPPATSTRWSGWSPAR